MKISHQTPKITVAIRKRPLNKKQQQRNQPDIITVNSDSSVVVSEIKLKVDLTKYIQQTTFNFDYAFNENSTNQQIYELSIRPLIQSAFQGAKISCFAYGQTGSGKTYTMKGDLSKGVPGLYFLGGKQIFDTLNKQQFNHLKVTVTFYQIYCGKLYDLLNNRTQLKIREDKNQNINVIGMQEKLISSAQQFINVIQYGSNFRITSQNASNAQSSRSHAILQITLKDGKKVFTKISFIDLAGNERGADHMDQGKQTKIDGAEINKSLLSLKQCIRALDQGKNHIPFRGSKLTMILKDSFVGFCKTIMIGNVSPNQSSSENTMNTLRYADRVKQMKKPNQGNKIDSLMLPRDNKNTIKIVLDRGDDQQDIMMKKQNAKKLAKQKDNKQRDYRKMEIEEPSPQIAPQPRKSRHTDVLYNDIRNYQQGLNIKRNDSKDHRKLSGNGDSTQKNYSNIVFKPNQPQQKQINLFTNNFNNNNNNNNITRSSQNNNSMNGLTHSNSNGVLKNNPMNFGNNGNNSAYYPNQRSFSNKMQSENNSNLQNEEANSYGNNFKIAKPLNLYNNMSNNGMVENNMGNNFINNNNSYHNQQFHQHHQNQYGINKSHHHFQSQHNYHHPNLENQQIQRNYRQLQDAINHQMNTFQTNHRKNIELEANIMKQEAELLQSFDLNHMNNLDYVMAVEESIDRKLNFLNNMRKNLSFLRDKIQESNQLSSKLSNNHESFGDQQLLEGLPGDQIMGRLF